MREDEKTSHGLKENICKRQIYKQLLSKDFSTQQYKKAIKNGPKTLTDTSPKKMQNWQKK